jgi:hypothetical protein
MCCTSFYRTVLYVRRSVNTGAEIQQKNLIHLQNRLKDWKAIMAEHII